MINNNLIIKKILVSSILLPLYVLRYYKLLLKFIHSTYFRCFIYSILLILALVGSLTVGTTFLMSPIAGVLVDRIGIRTTTFIGGFIATNSLLISSYFTHQVSYNKLLFHLQFLKYKQ